MDMKPLWAQTFAWIVAVAIALLFALGNPEGHFMALEDLLPHGSETPR